MTGQPDDPPAVVTVITTTCDGTPAVACACGEVCECASPAEAAGERWRHAVRRHAPWRDPRRYPSRRERPTLPTFISEGAPL